MDGALNASSQKDVSKRWWMLLLLSLCLIALTLNWFDIAAAFPQLVQQFGLQVSQLTGLISLSLSLFILGFAIFHIPAGMLAYRIGVKNTLLLEALGAIACYWPCALSREQAPRLLLAWFWC